ncbi:MAG: hypothetical protein P4L73_03510 [Caulobacteraceae bacterium]|nr:hypothetical protein [Caulobacteraceae bacterium]
MSDRACRVCGCTWFRACLTEDGPCWWVEDDLCSACDRLGPAERLAVRRRRSSGIHAVLCVGLVLVGLAGAVWFSGVLS